MVDQPNHKSYKLRGHTRQRKSSKPYSRPSEPKNKGLLEKVKDYLSPSWLFGYFSPNEEDFETSNLEDDVLDQNAVVTHEEGSTSSSYVPNQGRLASLEEENKDETFARLEVDNDSISGDKAQVFDENNGKQDRVENADLSIRLSGCLNDDVEDENEQQINEEMDRPHHSVSLYSSEQLTRKPLPSLLYSRSSSSSLLLQRGTPSLRSQGNSLLGSTRSHLNAPSVKLSTPMTSSCASFSSTQKPSSSQTRPLLTRNSSLKDNNLTQTETSTVDTTSRFNTSATSSATQPAGSSAPLFSMEKFVTPVQRTFTNKRVGSPSYPGPVMYGGALNVSRDVPSKRRRTSSPGSESYHPVSKLRIRGVKEIQHSTLGGTGTRTAQRILDALESVSSPLKDVRHIPSPIKLASASPLTFMASKTRTTPPKTRVGPRVSYLQAKLLGDPPVSSLQTPEVAKVSFVEEPTSREPQPSSSPTSPPSQKQPVKDHAFFSGLKDTVLKSSLPSSFAPKSLPTSLSPIENTSKSSGKIRAGSRSAVMHYSSYKNNTEDEVVNPLPEIRNAVPLTLDPGKGLSLPMFNAAKTTDDGAKLPNISQKALKKQKELPAKDKLLTESPKNGFIFSSPAPKSQRFSMKESLEIADDEVSFSFSEPVPVRKNSESTKETFKNPQLQFQNTSNSFKPTVNHSPNENMKSDYLFSKSPLTNDITFGKASGKSREQPAKALGKPEPAQTIDFAQRFAPAAGSWECTSCMINNEASAVKCVACETAKPSAGQTSNLVEDKQEKPEINLMAKFAAPKDSWECETCLIRNKSELNKCVACETKKPGSDDDLKPKFLPPSDSWECPTCMILNKAADLKCVACQTSKPGSSSNNDLKVMFAASTGSWECGTCMIRNKPDDVKCVACGASKPGVESTGSTQSGFTLNQTSVTTTGFTFGGSSTSTGFTFGSSSNNSQSSDPAKTSAFTFGQSSTTSSQANFSFGNNTETTTKASSTFGSTTSSSETKPVPGFSFGGNSSGESTITPSFTFGVTSNQDQNKPSFSFGTENTSNENGGIQKENNNEKVNEKPSTAPTMNIAEAAAAGLLKVPGKDDTTAPQSSTAVSVTVPTFTFGASAAPSKGPEEQQASNKTSSLGFTPIITAQAKPFAFQASTTASTKTTTGALFTFGAQQPVVSAVSLSTAKAASLFSFTGSSSAAVSSATTTSTGINNTPFSFNPSNTATSLPNATVSSLATNNSASPFNFSGSSGNTLSSAKAPLPSAQSNPGAIFSFTGSTSTEQAKSTPVFNFGAVNGPTSSNGPSVSTGQTGLFSFTGTQQSSTTPVVENQNSMGGEEMDADSNNNHDQTTFPQPSGGFNFTTPGNTSSLFPGGNNATPASGGFNFGAGVTSTFQFGGSTNTSSGGFNFGATGQTAGSTPFMFGGASTPVSGNTNTTPGSSFNFGGTSSASKPQLNVGQTAEQPALFNMGAAQSQNTNNRVYRKAVRRTTRRQ